LTNVQVLTKRHVQCDQCQHDETRRRRYASHRVGDKTAAADRDRKEAPLSLTHARARAPHDHTGFHFTKLSLHCRNRFLQL